jgi:hypothetical protein
VEPFDQLSPSLLAWLEQRGLGFAVAAVWIWTLLRERTASTKRSEQLSDALCRAIESGSQERARMADEYRLGHDWTVRSLLDHFRALAEKREPLGLYTQVPSRSSNPHPKPSNRTPESDSPRSTTPDPNRPMTPPPTLPKRTK